MDLRSWLTADLSSLRGRLENGVLSIIPADRRTERVDGGGIAPVYVIWHTARHQDVAVNRVLGDGPEVVEAWTSQLGVDTDLWRGLAEAEDTDMVDLLDPEAVDRYALAVIDRTIERVDSGELDSLDSSPDTDAALASVGVPEDRFSWLYDMWRGKPAAFFVQWEAIGHGYNHLGELIATRNRMGLSPF